MKELLVMLVLLLGGLILILAEICTPTFGLLAVAALVCFGVVVYKCFLIAPGLGLTVAVVMLIGLPFYLYYLMKFFPNTGLGRRLMLGRKEIEPGSGVPESDEFDRLIGREGVATSTPRPSGTINIDGQRIVATAEGGFIAEHTRVRVIKSSGLNVVVRAIEETPAVEQDQGE